MQLLGQKKSNLDKFKYFPTYENVINNFFTTYSFARATKYRQLTLYFAKKPAGWFIQLEDNTTKQIQEIPFWEYSHNYWKALPFARIPLDSVSQNTVHLEYYLLDSVFFEHNLLYGYKGWEKDVIAQLTANVDSLNPRYFYQLGRAYSSLATVVLQPSLHYPNEFIKYDSTFNAADISAERLNKFITYSDSSIYCYRKTYQLTQDFQTIVGSINDDWSNEHMKTFIWLSMSGQSDGIARYLRDDLYNPLLLNYYKDLLDNCDSNSILITSGDNPTYALTYIQEKLNFRKDITLVCKNFLGTGRYMNFISRLLPPSKSIKLALSANDYKLDRNQYITYDSLASILKFNGVFVSDNDLPSLMVRLPLEKNKLLRSYPELPDNVTDTITLDISSKSAYLHQNKYSDKENLAFVDLFTTNTFQRPIFFSNYGEAYKLDNYVLPYGLAFKLEPEQSWTSSHDVNIINYKILCNKLDYSGVKDISVINRSEKNIILNYAYSFYLSLLYLYYDGSSAMSEKVLNKYFQTFPDTLVGLNKLSTLIAKYYYSLKQSASGDSAMTTMANAAMKDLFHHLTFDNYNEDAILESIGIINDIEEIVSSEKRPKNLINKIALIKKNMKKAYNEF